MNNTEDKLNNSNKIKLKFNLIKLFGFQIIQWIEWIE